MTNRTVPFLGLGAATAIAVLTFSLILPACGPNWIVPVDDPLACSCGADDGGDDQGDGGGTPNDGGGTPSDGGVCDGGTPPGDGGTPPKEPPTCKPDYSLKNGKCHKDSCNTVKPPPDDDKCSCSKAGHGKGSGHCKDKRLTHSQGHGNGHCKYDCE